MAQWTERRISNPDVAGSSPAKRVSSRNLGEKVPDYESGFRRFESCRERCPYGSTERMPGFEPGHAGSIPAKGVCPRS